MKGSRSSRNSDDSREEDWEYEEDEHVSLSVRMFRENLKSIHEKRRARFSRRENTNRALSPSRLNNSLHFNAQSKKALIYQQRGRILHRGVVPCEHNFRVKDALPSSLDEDDVLSRITSIAFNLEKLKSDRNLRRQIYSKYYDDDDDGHDYPGPETNEAGDEDTVQNLDLTAKYFSSRSAVHIQERIPSFFRP